MKLLVQPDLSPNGILRPAIQLEAENEEESRQLFKVNQLMLEQALVKGVEFHRYEDGRSLLRVHLWFQHEGGKLCGS